MLVVVSLLAAVVATARNTTRATDSTFVIHAGARLRAELDEAVSSGSAKPGDHIRIRTTDALRVDGEVVVPLGTVIDAVLDTVVRSHWPRNSLGLSMHVTRVELGPTYAMDVALPARATTTDADWLALEHQATVPGVISVAAPVLGTILGAIRGGNRGAGVGAVAGSVVGVIAGMFAAAHADVAARAGTPVDLVLDVPLELDRSRTMAAVVAANGRERIARTRPQRANTCYNPGTPGTPNIVIPGTPATPGVGGAPGFPGTPDIIIPGTPGTPGSWEPC